ncbi:hypothetical protein D3C81_1436140 [compost metagenome]
MLGTAELVTGDDHRRALGQQQGGEVVAHLAHAQGIHTRVVGRPLDTAVPRQVVVGAVLVVLVVVFVVLVVVRHQVAQGEAIVGGDEIDRGIRAPAAVVEHVARRGHARSEVGQLAFITFPERPHGVAEAVVPLRPARREVAHLIATGAAIPRLGNQLDLAEHRVLAAGDEEAVAFAVAIVVTTEDGRQVEAKAIHMHLAGPITQ